MSAFLLGRFTPESIPLPLGGQVSCGFPSPAADYQNPDLSLDQLVGITPTSSIFLFLASGDSMIGAGIHDSDILVVEKGREAKSGDVVLAIIGAEFLVKRLEREADGSVRLVAENDRYPPVVLGDAEVLEVWGVCAWVLHRL
ncbi:LexA family protein [Stutzerimonas stutzeri]|jgi:DNA polymerase V|uniref:LexA family protein n=1 Tax=Stutzerimonas stutzeri TaxID=316 RepID=UPI001E7238A2|nr:translesion error-prone DNA polymerase V autoproteolytic subunit [Stutzerimonas stutzeri]CAB5556459.1 DNA polymerase V subunit UmuD [Stutzerimonas stutzeri]CAB5598123.1 DNA polymerase V subunit UmuD [Stutzerimonas stutzeri]CAC9158982.1 DNA polymerase V subunit UmuD [Stutzerimonas stutzeri]CAD0188341.1 Metabolism_regulation [Stutzerimonas stutzeri]